MDKKLRPYEEPNLVNPELWEELPKLIYSPFRTYDIEIWSDSDSELCVTAYAVFVDINDPQEIGGTDYDIPSHSITYSIADESVFDELDWWLCSYLSKTDWTDLEGFSEWTTYYGDTEDFEAEAMGNGNPMPDKIRMWLDNLPEYEPEERQP